MKYLTTMHLKYLTAECAAILILCSLIYSCNTKGTISETKETPVAEITTAQYEVAEDKTSLADYYNLDHIKEWYPERILPPPFDYDIDLSGKSVVELSLLRNEIFARNGYLFEDAVLRGYFNQYKWYQPIFDVPDFRVRLTKQEQDFINKVLARENELAKSRYVKQGDYQMIDLAHVYNEMQFKSIDENLKEALAMRNFAIVPAKHDQLFHVYDNNHYEYIPNFITTDLYLQVLHEHFSTLLQKIEEEKFIPILTALFEDLSSQSVVFEKNTSDPQLRKAAQWAAAYLGIANYLITGRAQITPHMDETYATETEKILAGDGTGSKFLDDPFMQYSQFQPRGNYTKTKELQKYFRFVKWLNTAPMHIGSDERFLSAILIASFIKNSPQNLRSFERFNGAVSFIAGDEDNSSMANLISLLSAEEAADPSLLNNQQKLARLREELEEISVNKIKPKGGDESTSSMLGAGAILFTAGRYTLDAEILSRLIHVLQPEPKRVFPKGLDVLASLGNQEAEKILLIDYHEAQAWKAYPDSLQTMKAKFLNFADWDHNLYSKTMEMITSLGHRDQRSPLFMKTPSWDRKNLITSMASWTELKHDMLLYAEQPMAAEAGEGGGPPPPQHISYVEPNTRFWEKSLALLDLEEQTLSKTDLLSAETRGISEELRGIGKMFLEISQKELSNEKVTADEFEYLSWAGGRIENLTFRIFGSDHLPEKEKSVAVVADVYNYNGKFLEEAVGPVDEIYVLVEINGKPYLTKGAVFSYYEFLSATPLTDEEWRERVGSGNVPERPLWTREITVNAATPQTEPGYSF